MRLPAVGGTVILVTALLGTARAQDVPESREGTIEQAEAEKAANLRPPAPDKAEQIITRISDIMVASQLGWHTFWKSAYSGGGFTAGAGYTKAVGAYDRVDMRGSITFSVRDRNGIHRPAPVRPARHLHGARRMARGH